MNFEDSDVDEEMQSEDKDGDEDDKILIDGIEG